ncbi:hypothetical protein [Moellerella wisconsensis]|uniref:hypothetical protein n=1 Tax=Moellerella wisconsensis TaxID=158849 RepID=UPI0030767F78
MILDPKDGVYISGTCFAIQLHVDDKSGNQQWRLLQINNKTRCYELVCCSADPLSIAIELTSYHVMRVKGKGIKTLDVYRQTVDVISRRCETAINLLIPETLGGVLNV